MLVLTRIEGEKIILNDGQIVITLLENRGNKSRIGIEAPREVRIDREEVFTIRQKENDLKSVA